MGILDTIIDAKQTDMVQHFEPTVVVGKILEPLKDRDRQIISKRFGLNGQEADTLETIGKQFGLTRERVRQIEKTLLKNMRTSLEKSDVFEPVRVLLQTTVADHGGVMSEDSILEFFGVKAQVEKNCVIFLLNLTEGLVVIPSADHVKESWASIGFNPKLLDDFIHEAKTLLENHGKPKNLEDFLEDFKKTDFYNANKVVLTDKVIINFLKSSQVIRKNPFGEIGLGHWSEIHPRDVGDKAYLVMKHHKKPEHYTSITELINKHGLDNRKAFKETVHNELIKDKRFILVGRGIYALAEWGYKSGVVADVIAEILKEKNDPLSRDQIVEEVMKRRMVKKNTILVGLSNKKLFKKIGKNMYSANQ